MSCSLYDGGKQQISVSVWTVAGFPWTWGFKVPLASAEKKEMQDEIRTGAFLMDKAPAKSKTSYQIRVWAEPRGETSCTSSTKTKELLSGICSLILVGKFAYFFFIFLTKEIAYEPETTKLNPWVYAHSYLLKSSSLYVT